MKREAHLRVSILDDSRASSCTIACNEETLEFIQEHLKLRYASEVEFEYLDLAQSISGSSGQALAERAKAEGVPLPLVIINGVVRLAGPLELRRILEAIDTEREVLDG